MPKIEECQVQGSPGWINTRATFLVRAAFRTSDRGRSLAIEHRRRTIADEDSEPPPTPDYTRNDAYSGQIFLAWVGGDDEDAMLYECKVGS